MDQEFTTKVKRMKTAGHTWDDISTWIETLPQNGQTHDDFKHLAYCLFYDEPITKPLICMADVQTQPVTFLWYPYIPMGKLTIAEGDPGIGKSMAMLAICTAVSAQGKLMHQDKPLDGGTVLLASAEDGLSDTIRPRLDAMGANVNNIFSVPELFTMDEKGIRILESWIREKLPALVVIDPLSAYISGAVDTHKSNQVRQITSKLKDLAEKYAPAIVAVRHLTKSASAKAIYRGAGSIDFTGAARSVLSFGRNDGGRGFVHIKSNLAPEGKAVGFDIEDGIFSWCEGCTLTKEEIMNNTDESNSALEMAKDFLREMIGGGGHMEYAEIITEAKRREIALSTLHRARKDLGVTVTVEGNQDGKRGRGKSLWWLE